MATAIMISIRVKPAVLLCRYRIEIVQPWDEKKISVEVTKSAL